MAIAIPANLFIRHGNVWAELFTSDIELHFRKAAPLCKLVMQPAEASPYRAPLAIVPHHRYCYVVALQDA
jgi:hypothetical protein